MADNGGAGATDAGLGEPTPETLKSDLRAVLDELDRAVKSLSELTDERDSLAADLESALVNTKRQRRELKQLRGSQQALPQKSGKPVGRSMRSLLWASAGGSQTPSDLNPGDSATPAQAQHKRHAKLLFDAAYYVRLYPEITAAGVSPWDHYWETGRFEARSPGPLFDADYYVRKQPELAASGADPLVHYLTVGWVEGRNPNSEFDSAWYLDQYHDVAEKGINPLIHYVTDGAADRRDPSPDFDTGWYVSNYLDVRRSGKNPLWHYLAIGKSEGRETGRKVRSAREVAQCLAPKLNLLMSTVEPSVNVIVDEFDSGSIFDGVATTAVAAALVAQRTNRKLRIVTRNPQSEFGSLKQLLGSNEIELSRNPEMTFVANFSGDFLEANSEDIFITSSWRTTASVLDSSVDGSRIAYFLHSDERDVESLGDARLQAEATMNSPQIDVVVRTQSLLDRLVESGIENLRGTATVFEPSIAAWGDGVKQTCNRPRRNLCLHARPEDPGDLFYLGIAALDAAITDGIFLAEDWDIHVMGDALPRFSFSDGSRPTRHEDLTWQERFELVSKSDLGICLTASTTPSNAALEFAASGAVVVTNQRDWRHFPPGSHRIVETDSTLKSIVEGLSWGLKSADDPTDRSEIPAPYSNSWRVNLADALDRVCERAD